MKLAVAIVLLTTACVPRVKPPTADYYLRQATWTACADFDPPHMNWTSEYGQRFYVVDGATCPDTEEMESIARRTLDRTGGVVDDIWGVRIIFVPTPIISGGGRESFGVTSASDAGVDILLTDRPGEWTSYRHELGHVIRRKRRGNGDGEHSDCGWWKRLENRDCGVWAERHINR